MGVDPKKTFKESLSVTDTAVDMAVHGAVRTAVFDNVDKNVGRAVETIQIMALGWAVHMIINHED